MMWRGARRRRVHFEAVCFVEGRKRLRAKEKVAMEAVWVGDGKATPTPIRMGKNNQDKILAAFVPKSESRTPPSEGGKQRFHSEGTFSNKKDDVDDNILVTIIEEESTILRENVHRLLECSGLNNLRLAATSSGGPSACSVPSWLPEPLRQMAPCTLLLENSSKSWATRDEPPCRKAQFYQKKSSDNEGETTNGEDQTEKEVEIEWEDPVLRDVYPLNRQSYSSEQKALKADRQTSQDDDE